MFILTRQANGFLFQVGYSSNNSRHLGYNASLLVFISEGFLQVVIEDELFSFDEIRLNDGEKHFLEISINQTNVFGRIDDYK